FFLLYLCMLLALGVDLLINKDGFLELIKKKYRSLIGVCLGVILSKVIITAFFYKKFFCISVIDCCSIMVLVFLAILIYLFSKSIVGYRLFCVIVFVVLTVDMVFYNYELKKVVLQPNVMSNVLSEIKKVSHSDNESSLFRIPFFKTDRLGGRYATAFLETMANIKSAFSRGANHHAFTTKRYYDFYVNIPIQKQFFLCGLVYPIVRFYPESNVIRGEKLEILHLLKNSDVNSLSNILYIEADDQNGHVTDKEFVEFDKNEINYDLTPYNIIMAYDNFYNSNFNVLNKIKVDPGQFLSSSSFNIDIQKFTSHELQLSIDSKNAGFVYFNDGWSKYWKAYSDGKEVPIYIANYCFKAVYVKEGKHLIRFVFSPNHYSRAVLLYLVSMIVLLIMLLFFKYRGVNKSRFLRKNS
ncbi:MAG: hypothetical protein ABIB11_06555, partial [Candidatus Omnitrophota bacterium]